MSLLNQLVPLYLVLVWLTPDTIIFDYNCAINNWTFLQVEKLNLEFYDFKQNILRVVEHVVSKQNTFNLVLAWLTADTIIFDYNCVVNSWTIPIQTVKTSTLDGQQVSNLKS